jgi:hypothetical protein
MKNISISILSFLFAGVSFGQGNLQFNQVKLVGSTAETVPSGKVWKIESAPLTMKNGTRVPPSFMIGSDTIIMGFDSYTTSILENVVSVKLEWKGNNSFSFSSPITVTGCGFNAGSFSLSSSGSNNVKLLINGVGNGATTFDEVLSFSNIPSGNSASFISIGTKLLSTLGNNSLSSWSLEFSPVGNLNNDLGSAIYAWGIDYTFRVTFLMANGNSTTYSISKNEFRACSQSGNISISGPDVGTQNKSRPQVSTQFPIWIPAGTAVKTLSNIGKLSILEFNVTQ